MFFLGIGLIIEAFFHKIDKEPELKLTGTKLLFLVTGIVFLTIIGVFILVLTIYHLSFASLLLLGFLLSFVIGVFLLYTAGRMLNPST